jgi:anti-anti-sigma regulatory factor
VSAPGRTEWRFDVTFRVTVLTTEDTTVAALFGDLDAITVVALRRNVNLAAPPGGELILDLSELWSVDMTGVREIRRIEQESRLSGARPCVRGASAEVRGMLDVLANSKNDRH